MPAAALGTAEWYRHFGTVDAPGSSPCYADWSLHIADDPELIARIDQWPYNKRQPLLMLAATRFLGANVSPYPEFRRFLDEHWAEVSRTVMSRATQTNEVGRCATLLPSLRAIAAAEGRPLALIEVGASAGLALFPDRYSYEFDDGVTVTRLGPGGSGGLPEPPVLPCRTAGPVPLPDALPEVVWRAGIDLNPLDVRNPDDVAWLEALIWPEQEFRRERLRRAIAIAREQPPLLVAGDLNEQLLSLAGQVPADAALVVFHSAVMGYLSADGRARFRATMQGLAHDRGCHWLSNEGETVIIQEDGSAVLPDMEPSRIGGNFLLQHNSRPVAITGPHGQSLDWL
ncbi:hypothetical protein ARGLB_008_01610 [Arthrobacter globiformis NBRC 12137]|uniref:DUF2332 domain-containing protein n=1 Tax=Arthrobacter globiformis (strain ATCC 8010 / DSM 20124 / JCM 1332 / NBRC 12137 / NCIMB 8907 / NRRL B-2979 / 168) TaxID=1077972 RepID=H0QH37_ARTG1|nr:DUF2332 domain-containing protein [Arthrobacter globiformis]GAB12138.1 hypothetical protein ARGLB_008_01610 [Arthrobacter globiformis NBRC 12137]